MAGEAAKGISEAARDTGVPVIFGVLTTENREQAAERAGPMEDNRGREAALAALRMADLMRKLDGPGGPAGPGGPGQQGGPK